MKKLLTTMLLLLSVFGMAMADDYAHDASVLPEAAKSVLKKNFKSQVSVVKIDKDFGRISEYEVVMNDGTEITFDSKGNWKEVETNIAKSVPANLVPEAVRKYVAKNHKSHNIVSIEKKRYGYEIELSNGIDIEFNKDGSFRKYD